MQKKSDSKAKIFRIIFFFLDSINVIKEVLIHASLTNSTKRESLKLLPKTIKYLWSTQG